MAAGRITLDDVVATVAAVSGFTIAELKSPRRPAPLVRARLIAYYAASRAGKTWVGIGRHLNRNHATVLVGAQQVRLAPARFEPELANVLHMLGLGPPPQEPKPRPMPDAYATAEQAMCAALDGTFMRVCAMTGNVTAKRVPADYMPSFSPYIRSFTHMRGTDAILSHREISRRGGIASRDARRAKKAALEAGQADGQ